MTQSNSEVFVVWVAGSEHHWYSCVLGVFVNREAALEYATTYGPKGVDPGDTIMVQGFVFGEPSMGGEDLLAMETTRDVA